jgi:CheY-specific phosphatase CheX
LTTAISAAIDELGAETGADFDPYLSRGTTGWDVSPPVVYRG